MSRRIEYTFCPSTGLRSFATERDAERALGRAQTSQRRRFDGHGTRRGMQMENRFDECDSCGGFHLASQSRREHQSHAFA